MSTKNRLLPLALSEEKKSRIAAEGEEKQSRTVV
jgi:hypothetical protein